MGGETAEMPGLYNEKDFDIAGFCVGVVEKDKIIDGNEIYPGDYVIGLYSSGIHSNGFSLVRKIISENMYEYVMDARYGNKKLVDILLKPTKIYVDTILNLVENYNIKGIAHITGGGLLENIPRILPNGTGMIIDKKNWNIPHIFSYIQKCGDVDPMEMFRVFNMGIGMVIVVSEQDVLPILREIKKNGCLIGQVISGDKKVYLG